MKKACAVNQPDLLGCFNTILRQSQGHTSSHGGICVPQTRAFQFAIRIDSSCESIRFVKNRPFASLVVMQFFLLIYCIVSAKNTPQCTQLKARRTTLGDRAFSVTAARAWNAVPSSVRSAPSLLQFRRDLKTALFQSSYSSP